ncbi:hypothetical protein, partial [Clostridium cochlearium]|uniref:hypothetical protein n=1 Tax=Clostridium cochlearium TaxID=1494 RepID=UPI001839885B
MKVSSFLRAVCTILIFLLVFFLSPFHINIEKNQSFNYGEFSKARVTEVIKSDSSNTEKIKVIVKKGKHKGEEFIVDNTLVLMDNILHLHENDEVLLSIKESSEGELEIIIY